MSVSGPVVAQVPDTVPAAVLERPLSVRSAGMNGAGAALIGNSGAVFTNPAGIATIRHIAIEGAYRATPSGGNLHAGALAWRMRQFDVGFGVARLRYGTDPGSSPLPGVPVGAEGGELAGIGSLIYRFGMIAFGGSGKYVQRTVNDFREGAFSADAGFAIAVFDIMAIGFSRQNIAGNWAGESAVELRGVTRLATMWNYVDPLESYRLLSTVELQWPEGDDLRVVLGAEGGIVLEGIGLLGRAAYVSVPSESYYSHMSYGGSVRLANITLDYAYQDSELSGDPAHRFGLRMSL